MTEASQETLSKLFEEIYHIKPTRIEPLAGAGSNRAYYRLTYNEQGDSPSNKPDISVIGVIGNNTDENRAFFYLTKHFTERQLPVPKLLAVSADERIYLQTDLGSLSLFDAVSQGRKAGGSYSDEEIKMWERSIIALPEIQILGAKNLDGSRCFPSPAFDEQNVLFDLHYFKYCFLMPSGVEFHELRLEREFTTMAKSLTSPTYDTFMFRDFQSRNVMLVDGAPHFIDYQGGRPGPVEYDVASYLWQASALMTDALREKLIEKYLQAYLRLHPETDLTSFRERIMQFVLLRTLQVLGAYGFRGYFERKQHFIDSIPPAIASLSTLLSKNICAPYPYLAQVLSRLTSLPRFATEPEEKELHVHVFSFSYKKGIPEDKSGNGGGYVFDCRAVHNPGRYDEYKKLTGLDKPVRDFLEKDGEIAIFLNSATALVDKHVERYIERGFTSLMICFGCTGGQHRSVYSAQHMARHISDKYGLRVSLCHREQGISQEFDRKSIRRNDLEEYLRG